MTMRGFLQLQKFQTLIGKRLNGSAVAHILKRTSSKSLGSLQQNRYYGSLHEPEYLASLNPEIPFYDLLNVQITGYDFSALESFAKYVHHTAERVGLEIEDCWATPCKKLKVTQFKPESTAVDTEYLLNLYERNVQICDAPTTLLPLFINIVESSIPAGVTMKIHPHLKEYTEDRYVPDLQLRELRTQLQTMKGDREK